MANETNQGPQTGGQQSGQKQNPSTPEQKKPNQIEDPKTRETGGDKEIEKQGPGRGTEQGNQPSQRRDPSTEQGEKDDQADDQKRKSA
jgi:hypothetical protein